MTRPAAEELRSVMFSPRPGGALVISDHAKRNIKHEWRCERRRGRHLLAFVVATQHGDWLAWRQPTKRTGGRRAQQVVAYATPEEAHRNATVAGWACRWFDEAPSRSESVYDPCRRAFEVDFNNPGVFGPANKART